MVAWSVTPGGVVKPQAGAEHDTGAGAGSGFGGAIGVGVGLRDGKRLSLPVAGSRAGWLAGRPGLCCSARVDQV